MRQVFLLLCIVVLAISCKSYKHLKTNSYGGGFESSKANDVVQAIGKTDIGYKGTIAFEKEIMVPNEQEAEAVHKSLDPDTLPKKTNSEVKKEGKRDTVSKSGKKHINPTSLVATSFSVLTLTSLAASLFYSTFVIEEASFIGNLYQLLIMFVICMAIFGSIYSIRALREHKKNPGKYKGKILAILSLIISASILLFPINLPFL